MSYVTLTIGNSLQFFGSLEHLWFGSISNQPPTVSSNSRRSPKKIYNDSNIRDRFKWILFQNKNWFHLTALPTDKTRNYSTHEQLLYRSIYSYAIILRIILHKICFCLECKLSVGSYWWWKFIRVSWKLVWKQNCSHELLRDMNYLTAIF